MTKFKIRRGLHIYNGGLLGAIFLAQSGGANAMIINDYISAFFINGHWSLKRQDGKENINNRTLRQIARKVLDLKKFKIEKRIGEHGVYNITPIIKEEQDD